MRSQPCPGSFDCSESELPSHDQYASAFSPSKVSWRRSRRCRSSGNAGTITGGGALGAAEATGGGLVGAGAAPPQAALTAADTAQTTRDALPEGFEPPARTDTDRIFMIRDSDERRA